MIIANGEYWYNLFYLLAFSIGFIIILCEGYDCKFPLIEWLLTILAINLCFIIGTKFITYSLQDWLSMYHEGYLINTTSKSVLGGFIGGILGLFLLKTWFQFGWTMFDNFALAIPLGLAIQRLGCFFYGCCYGTISNIPWAVQYPINTLVHYHHYSKQLIGINDVVSLGVHPVQLYHSLVLLVVFFLLLYFKKSIKKAGNLFLISLMLIAISRFIIEFFRARVAHTFGAEVYGMFNSSQWGMLITLILLLFFFILNSSSNQSIELTFRKSLSINKSIILFLAITLVYIGIKNWLGEIEQIVILVLLYPTGIAVGWKITKTGASQKVKWLSLGFLLLPITLLAQKTVERLKNDSIIVYHLIGVGYMQGTKNNSLDIGVGSGCDRVSNTEYFNHEYYLESIQYKKVTINNSKKVKIYQQFDLFGGEHIEIRFSDNYKTRNIVWGGSANFVYEGHIIGIGGGLIIGNLIGVHNDKEKDGRGFPEIGHFNTPIFPRAYLRIGREDIFFGEFNLANDFPNSLISSPLRVGIGTGLGTKNGIKLRTGLMDIPKQEYEFSIYALLEIPFKNNFIIQSTFVTHKASDFNNYPDVYNPNRTYQLGLGVNYKFGTKTKKSTKPPKL